MTDPALRETLARISARPSAEWTRRLEQAFPRDPALRMQALLWLHAEKDGMISEVLVRAGDQIDAKDLLIVYGA